MARNVKYGNSGILSMDATKLCGYIRKRFDPALNGTNDLDETRDVAFQILANKAEFESNPKKHLKVFYTLVRAHHSGFFTNPLFRNSYIGFPYLDEYYKENYTIYDPESYSSKRSIDFHGHGDSLLFNAGRFLLENAANIIKNHLMRLLDGHIEDLSGDDPYNIGEFLTRDIFVEESLSITNLSIKIILELWIKHSLPQDIAKPVHSIAAERLNVLTDKIGELKSQGKKFQLSQFLALYSCLTAVNLGNPRLLAILLEKLSLLHESMDIKTKVLFLFALSKTDQSIIQKMADAEVESYKNIVAGLFFSLENNVNSLELKEALLLVHAMEALSFKRTLLDRIVVSNLEPKYSLMRMEDTLNILGAFVNLDYRCSYFLNKLNNDQLLGSFGPVDLAIMCIRLDLLRQPVNHLLEKLSFKIDSLVKIANRKVLESLGKLYEKHQKKNEFLDNWLQQTPSHKHQSG